MLFLLKVITPSESHTIQRLVLVLRWDLLRHILLLGFVLAALTLHSGRALTSVC